MLLLISASISAILGLSSISDLFGHQGGWGVIRNTALQVFGLLTAGLSTLNLSSDLNSGAEKHRSIANKYLSFGRDARHLLERVDIHRVQICALTIDSMDMNALGVCS